MSKEKYYTPNPEEFCIGFEYEFKPRLRDGFMSWVNQDFRYVDWYKKQIIGRESENLIDLLCDYGDPYSIDDVMSYLKDNVVRVKCLDKEDIESLGFNYIMTSYDGYWQRGEIQIAFVYDNRLQISTGEWSILVDIKNKSELKKLLKQLGIINE